MILLSVTGIFAQSYKKFLTYPISVHFFDPRASPDYPAITNTSHVSL